MHDEMTFNFLDKVYPTENSTDGQAWIYLM